MMHRSGVGRKDKTLGEDGVKHKHLQEGKNDNGGNKQRQDPRQVKIKQEMLRANQESL